MWRVYDCLVNQHDYRLVLTAAAICLFGSLATFVIADRALRAKHGSLIWLALAAVCAGTSIWSTHFVAMLAFQQTVPISYAFGPTVGSLLAGIVIIGCGFAITLPRTGRVFAVTTGGLVVGAGIVILHYVGMSALRLPGQVTYDVDLVILSIAFSLTLGAASFFHMFHRGGSRGWIYGLLLFVLMVVTLHFTAMGAVRIELGLWEDFAAPGISRETLASWVTVSTIAFLAIGLAGALFDRRLSASLQAQAQRFRMLSESALEGLVIHRGGTLIDSNAAARRLLSLGEQADDQSVFAWFATTERSQVEEWLLQPSEEPVETQMIALDGRRFPAEVCGRILELSDGSQGQILAFRDVTARKQAESQLQHQALHDPLTDLPNRRLFHELAGKVLAKAQRQSGQFAVFALDLDSFKMINDLYGHGGGDRLLVELATRIQQNLRGSDIVARFGGDEFAVIETGPSQPNNAAMLAERLIDQISAPIQLDDTEVVVAASIGIALYPHDGRTIEELVRNADTAMYRAKADGKGIFRFFEPQMNDALEARRTLEGRLRRAIANGELTVAYQPIVDSRTRLPEGFEALGRWVDEKLGSVSPADFIPVAEETGLIIPLGEHVLRTACRDAVAWPVPLRVAVNLSAIQFRRPGLAPMVESILHETGLSGDRLELEITESILIDNRDQVLETLRALKALGIRISMDDFGTGYSSLSYLQSFPFDKIKIDRVFVSDLSDGSQNAPIVRAIAAMGHSLQMKVVAEGVETEDQARQLHQMSCDEVQGFLIARPMQADAVAGFLRRVRAMPEMARNVA